MENPSSRAAGVLFLVLLGVLFYRMKYPATTFAADGIDSGWDAAAERSQGSGEPTVVLFTAGWCPTCKMLHSNTLARSDVLGELQSHYNFYTVDLTNPTAAVQQHAQKYRVSGIPLLIRYDANGKETDRTNYLSPEDMISWLKAGE